MLLSMTTSRQKLTGERIRSETRRVLLGAAAAEFESVGYLKTTVANIARRAGVTVQTLYLAWGSKRELLRAYLSNQLVGDDDPTVHFQKELEDSKPLTAEEVVERIAAIFVAAAGRASTAWRIYRDAAPIDPEIAEDWHQLQTRRRGTLSALVSHLPKGAIRSSLTEEELADTVWAVASPDSYILLLDYLGYDPVRYQAWLTETLKAAILDR